jgi:hypothetical protein
MPASSVAQQNFMRLVYAYKTGGLKKSEVSPQIVATAKEMTKKQIDDYTTAKKNAPDKAPMARQDMPEASIDVEGISLQDLIGFLAQLDKMEQNSMPWMSRSKQYLRLN